MKNIVLIALCSAMLVACKKEEGVGGDASISGLVWTYRVNGSATDTIAEYPAEDTYVYIVFGDNVGYDKRIKTDYNGEFKFNYLYPGDYTLYVYSFDPDPNVLDERSPVIRNVKIEERKENAEVERIEILSQ
jgi:predicted small secreted protein